MYVSVPDTYYTKNNVRNIFKRTVWHKPQSFLCFIVFLFRLFTCWIFITSLIRKFAATRDSVVQVFHAPGKTYEFNPFVLYKTFPGHVDDAVSLDWSSDSRYFDTL